MFYFRRSGLFLLLNAKSEEGHGYRRDQGGDLRKKIFVFPLSPLEYYEKRISAVGDYFMWGGNLVVVPSPGVLTLILLLEAKRRRYSIIFLFFERSPTNLYIYIV